MNQIDFTQPGGFPLDQDVFGFQQTNIFTAAQTAMLAGPLAILGGCVVAGGIVSNGYVVINGEILPFVGGAVQNKVVIIQTAELLNYEDGMARPSQLTRYATFGDDGVTNNLWASFKRNSNEGVLARLDRLEVMAAPFTAGGGMVLWNKAANLIPAGWQEVINWRGRLPMGYDPANPLFDEPGTDFGGEVNHTIVKVELPANIDIAVAGNGSGSTGRISTNGSSAQSGVNIPFGGGQSFSLLNPYRVVVFIEPIPAN